MTESIEKTLLQNVTRGAEWLDSCFPGWERSIDLATFDIVIPCLCVLGQVVGQTICLASNFYAQGSTLDGYQTVFNLTVSRFCSRTWMSEHGFAAPDHIASDRRQDSWQILNQLWIDLLKERFDTGNLSDIEDW